MNTINENPGAPSGSQVQGQGPEGKKLYFVKDGKLFIDCFYHYAVMMTLWNIARVICGNFGYYVNKRDGVTENGKHYEEFCLIEMRNPDASYTSWIRFIDDVSNYKLKCHDGIETSGYYDIPIVEVVDDVDFITDTETLADRFLKRIGLKEYGVVDDITGG